MSVKAGAERRELDAGGHQPSAIYCSLVRRRFSRILPGIGIGIVFALCVARCAHVRAVDPEQLSTLCPARFESGSTTTSEPRIVGLTVLSLLEEPEQAFVVRAAGKQAKPPGMILRAKPLLPVVLEFHHWEAALGIPPAAWHTVGRAEDEYKTVVSRGRYQVEMRYASQSPRSSAGVCVATSAPFAVPEDLLLLTTQ